MKTEAKERPIIFSTPMVQALLDGRKTQTRRIVKAPYQSAYKVLADKDYPYMTHNPSKDNFHFIPIHGDTLSTKCPHGDPGDVLWVRETWRPVRIGAHKMKYWYKADGHLFTPMGNLHLWKSPLFMPKEASRIKLLVKDRWVERLNDISEEDAIAEGIEPEREGWKSYEIIHKGKHKGSPHPFSAVPNKSPISSYMELWESLHGPGSWSKNPWVWVLELKIL